jgi:hypothetical protein
LSSYHNPGPDNWNKTELDSHADTCVAGANTVPLWYTDHKVSVSPFIGEYAPLEDVPVASVATAYDNPVDGSTIVLVINEALYFGDRMSHSLLCPNQLRDFGIIVNDTPSCYDRSSSFSIVLPDSDIEMPLLMRGVISYIETRKPTEEELLKCERYELTSATPWDPYLTPDDEMGQHTAIREVQAIAVEKSSQSCCPPELTEDILPRIIKAVQFQAPVDDVTHHEADVIAHAASQRGLEALQATSRKNVITKEVLAQRWYTGLESADRTLLATTQEGLRYVEGDLERRLKTSKAHLRFPTLNCVIYSDTLFAKTKSVRGYTCAQLFTDGHKFIRIYPMSKKADAHHALTQFIQDVGIPKNCLVDCAPEERHGEWGRIVKHYHIKLRTTEAYSPWQNRAEASIGEIKKLIGRVLRKTGAPVEFWCYVAQWAAKVISLTAHDLPILGSRTPEERITGKTPDISEYANYSWYQWVWYRDRASFPDPLTRLGRWVGVSNDVGQAMTYWVLTEKCTIIARSSIKSLEDYELRDPMIISQQESFTNRILDRSNISKEFMEPFVTVEDKYELEPEEEMEVYTTPDADEFTPESYDEYLLAQVSLPVGEDLLRGSVIRRTRDHNGRPIGTRNVNPILDTREYDVQFPDGTVRSYIANTIAENLYSQVDAEGRSFSIFDEIIDHKSDDTAVGPSKITDDETRFTTRGWKFLVSWKDGTSSYVPLREMKETYPLQTAEYASSHGLSNAPAFKWWVPFILKKRTRIIQKLGRKGSKYWHRTHKYGIELPKTVMEALEIDRRTGTTFWREAIEKEMRNVGVAFQFNPDDTIPIGHKLIKCHMIFDVKMVGLVRKARFVAGGHMTDPPLESVYSSVVTRESVRIMFTIAALNDLDLMAGDVQNAYINAKTAEKVYTIAGPEFGSDQGRPAVIVRALYGLKSSGARWRDHLAAILRENGFKSSKADADVWMRKAMKHSGFIYWEYLLAYVDDILVISHDPRAIIDALSKSVTFKQGSVGPPKSYLGADVFQITIHDATLDTPAKQVWAMSATEYVRRAIEEVSRELALQGAYLPKRVETPLSSGYRPELDFSAELDSERTNYYQGLIGVLRWIVELGRIDLIVPVSLLSRFMVSPREGHLQQCYHIFAYLKQFNRSRLIFDDSDPSFGDAYFHVCDWSEYYPDASEPIPPNAPEALGHAVSTTCYVDADHAGCRVTRRSQTGIIVYMQKAPVVWYSKRQNTVESATFGSEFIALKTAIDHIDALRYKLRMFGIPLNGPTSVFCDNESVVKSAVYSESTLKRKHTSIAYHRCREAQAAKYVQIGFERGENNPADILTKLLPGSRMRALLRRLFYWNKNME